LAGYLSEIQAVIPAQIHRLPVGADGGRLHIAAIGIGCDLRDSRDARIGAHDAKIVIDPAAVLAFCRIPASVELVVVSRIVKEDLARIDGRWGPYSTGERLQLDCRSPPRRRGRLPLVERDPAALKRRFRIHRCDAPS
jgi:hypothetical protein